MRTGLEETCIGERPIGVGLNGRMSEATWTAVLTDVESSVVDEFFVLEPTVLTATGVPVSNPAMLGVARSDSILLSTQIIDARPDSSLDPTTVVEDMIAALQVTVNGGG